MAKPLNRDLIAASRKELSSIIARMEMLETHMTENELDMLNGMMNRVSDHASRIRYRIGLILEGQE